jgi:hypothetical protein
MYSIHAHLPPPRGGPTPFFILTIDAPMHKTLALVAVLALAGCATASPTYLKDGRQGLSIDCSGEAMKWQQCYDKATQSCNSGHYQVLARNGVALTTDDQSITADPGTYKNRNLVISCK